MEKNASVWAYIMSASTALGGWFTLERTAIVVGLILSVGTFFLNWWYRDREYRLKERKYGTPE